MTEIKNCVRENESVLSSKSSIPHFDPRKARLLEDEMVLGIGREDPGLS
jgi:hypothetical protein